MEMFLTTLLLTAAVVAHDHGDIANTQEPFVGWSKEDLDAKWGTDVCCLVVSIVMRTAS
jgi:hypothetical protein